MRELTGGRLLRRSFRRHRGRVTAGMLLLAGHQCAEALVPVLIGVIIGSVTGWPLWFCWRVRRGS